MGRRYSIEISQKRFLKSRVFIQGTQISIFLSEDLNESHANLILKEYIIKFAKNYIIERCKALAIEHGFYFKSISIKEQRTRWGSCSSHKNLNFNWRLILASPEVVDYVILHELSHTKEMNHKASFWNIVRETMPEYRIHQEWLKQNGRELWSVLA